MGFRHVVEGEDAPAEAEEEECAEGDEGPEGELLCAVRWKRSQCLGWWGTHNRDDLLLDQRREGDEFEKEG